MPPRKSTAAAGTASRSKKAAGLSQPTLAFQSQRPTSLYGKTKPKGLTKNHSTTSISSIDVDSTPSPVAEVVELDLPKIKAGESKQGEKAAPLSERVHVQSGGKRAQLDVKSKEWKGLVKDAKVAMGGLKPIHAGPDTHNDIHHILRVFDMTSSYGPCVGITRLQRWERAKKWGLNPPDEIRSILTTQQGEDDVAYRETVFHGWV
ncbi:hypothetical protein IAU60_001033 [Kwoniella sp. DSM 27419]